MRHRDDFLRCLGEDDRSGEDAGNWIGRRVGMSGEHPTPERLDLIRGPCKNRSQSAAGVAHLPATAIFAVLESVSLACLARRMCRGEKLVGHPPVTSDRLQPIERLVLSHRFMHCGLPAVILAMLLTRPARRCTRPTERSILRARVLPPRLRHVRLPGRGGVWPQARRDKAKSPSGEGPRALGWSGRAGSSPSPGSRWHPGGVTPLPGA